MAKKKPENSDDELLEAVRRLRASRDPATYSAYVLENALAAEGRIRTFLHERDEVALSATNVAEVLEAVPMALPAPSLVWFLEELRSLASVEGPKVIATAGAGGMVKLANIGTEMTTLGEVMGAQEVDLSIAGAQVLPPERPSPSARQALDRVLKALRNHLLPAREIDAAEKRAMNRNAALTLVDWAVRMYYTTDRFGTKKKALGELARDLGLKSGSAALARRLLRWRAANGLKKKATKGR